MLCALKLPCSVTHRIHHQWYGLFFASSLQDFMIQQGIDDPGELIGGFHEIVARSDTEQMRDGTGVKLGLVEVAPGIQTLKLEHALLHD